MTARAGRKEARRSTYQHVLDAPPHKVAEVIGGTLHAHPRPASRHAWASSGISAKISPPFNYGDGGPGGWTWVRSERSMLARESATSGLSTPMHGRSRHSSCARGSGCCWPHLPVTRRSRSRLSMPSSSHLMPSGPK